MGDVQATDYMLGILHDPFHRIHMGITAENVAARDGISREMQDALAVESHAARRARDRRGPLQVADRPGGDRRRARARSLFDTDEHVRADTTVEAARQDEAGVQERTARSPPAMPRASTTAPRAVVLATATARRSASRPEAAGAPGQLRACRRRPEAAWASARCRRRALALKRAGLTASDLDVIESNEAFAAQACAVTRALELDPAKVNPNGSGISLGHPVGATGAIITTKAIYELQRIGGRYALVTMCIGGGQGIAAIFERV